ncbi:hypothetical protein Tco_1363692 [Tanacetum coccineum]
MPVQIRRQLATELICLLAGSSLDFTLPTQTTQVFSNLSNGRKTAFSKWSMKEEVYVAQPEGDLSASSMYCATLSSSTNSKAPQAFSDADQCPDALILRKSTSWRDTGLG